MKKSVLFLFLVLISSVIIAQQVKYTYNFDDYKIINHGEYQLIEFDNTLSTGITGEPILPYRAVKLLLPFGQSAQNIEIIAEDLTKIEGKYNLFPQQYVRPISNTEIIEFIINKEVYNKTKYPEKQINNVSTQFMNGYSFALSTFTPVVYNPKTGELSFYKKITIIVDYSNDKKAENATKNLNSSIKTINKVKNFAQNPEILNSYPQKKTSDEYQVLIITTSAYENSFEDLQSLYLTRGLLSEVITKSEIEGSTSGQDTQEKIRNYIIDEYNNHGIEYVMLAGDTELIPYRGFYCQVQSSSVYEDWDIPSDLYYSAIDGNWNTDGDDKWAEPDEDDLLPEIAVGRLPFSNTTELNSMLNKIISYQNEPITGELDNPLLAGEYLYDDPLTWGAQYLELLIGFHDDNGYETTGIPEEHPYEEMYHRDGNNWDGNDIIQEINTGHSFVHHCGHAGTEYTMQLYIEEITNSNFNQVNGTTHNYTLVYTHGCICGDFSANDCIGEQMVKINNFAVAFVGNSRYGWFNEGQTEGPSAHIHREFIDALYDQKENHIGATHMISKYNTAPWVEASGQHEPGALRWCFYDCNVLADPTLQIWTDEPISFNANFETEVIFGNDFEVTVTTAKEPIENMSCTIIQNNLLIGVAKTNSEGVANIDIDEDIAELGAAQLIITGYNCLKTTYDITIIEGAVSINDLNSNNILIYPNPTTGIFTITNNSTIKQSNNSTIKITNLTGKIIKQLTIEQFNNLTIDLSEHAKGVYMIEINNNGEVSEHKIVVE